MFGLGPFLMAEGQLFGNLDMHHKLAMLALEFPKRVRSIDGLDKNPDLSRLRVAQHHRFCTERLHSFRQSCLLPLCAPLFLTYASRLRLFTSQTTNG